MHGPHPDDMTFLATPGDAHAEWHRNAGVPMGQPGCPQDACDGDYYWDEETTPTTSGSPASPAFIFWGDALDTTSDSYVGAGLPDFPGFDEPPF